MADVQITELWPHDDSCWLLPFNIVFVYGCDFPFLWNSRATCVILAVHKERLLFFLSLDHLKLCLKFALWKEKKKKNHKNIFEVFVIEPIAGIELKQ